MKREGISVSNKRVNKRGQVTVFIIIAILIVALALAIYFLRPGIQSTTGFDEENPKSFIQTCIEDEIENAVNLVSIQGGSIVPEHYFIYNDVKIEYLCYTNENLKLCSVQQPLLKQHIESEIENDISDEVSSCFGKLVASYESEGYDTNLETGTNPVKVELLPKRIVATFNYTLTATKNDAKRYDFFDMILNNNLYELTSIAKSIVEWETEIGDADPALYMTYYSDLKVQKNLRDDGTKIYTITDRNTDNKFQFASRSLVWPAGF